MTPLLARPFALGGLDPALAFAGVFDLGFAGVFDLGFAFDDFDEAGRLEAASFFGSTS